MLARKGSDPAWRGMSRQGLIYNIITLLRFRKLFLCFKQNGISYIHRQSIWLHFFQFSEFQNIFTRVILSFSKNITAKHNSRTAAHGSSCLVNAGPSLPKTAVAQIHYTTSWACVILSAKTDAQTAITLSNSISLTQWEARAATRLEGIESGFSWLNHSFTPSFHESLTEVIQRQVNVSNCRI